MSTARPALQISSERVNVTAPGFLAVPVFEDEPVIVSRADASLEAEVERARTRGGFSGKRFETLLLTPGESNGAAPTLLLLGAGSSREFTRETCRRLGAAAVMAAAARGGAPVFLFHRVPESAGAGEWTAAWAEGLTLGEFAPGRYKTEPRGEGHCDLTVVIPGATPEEQSRAAAAGGRARLVAGCVNLARELVNEPANLLPPRVLADRARAAAEGTTLRVDVLDAARIVDLGMGLIMGVAQGSQEPPRVIVIEHRPSGVPARPVLGLVGKGVTFDSGGISIKPALNMERMKDDMAGGAAVVAALRAISLLDVPLHVVGVIPAVENMPSGSAIRPGDVLRGASGRTVEVIDTDAEGRLILGDALWYAQRLGATHLVDIATLTGACAVALGKTTTGVFGRPQAWGNEICRLGDDAGDRCWALPLFDDYRDLLKSDIADTVNVGGRHAGAITAALFVGEFAGSLPWAHLDIAGTAWNDDAKPYAPKGPTGVGVRTLTALAEAMSRGMAGA